MRVLPGVRNAPSVLLARLDRYDPDAGRQAAEDAGAWRTWRQVGTTSSPQQIIRLVGEAGLRGRGGAGHSTAEKWRAAAEIQAEERYLVANGFEADPGAQLDRTLMERDPHLVLEGVAIAAYAIGARRAYICVKAGAQGVIHRLQAAIEASEEGGLLGPDALGSGFDLDVEVVGVPGGFVVGEETVLLRALENKRAQPEQRPPYPSRKGLWGRPTVVNNVETLAALPWLLANGPAAYAGIGDVAMPGTTLVQVTGAVGTPGIVEVPTGMPIGSIVDELAGGVRKGSRLKAVLVGGPSGSFLPPDQLGVGYSAAALGAHGAVMGSGTVVALDEDICLFDMATLLQRFLSDESCGKTIPCRIGVRRLYEIGARAVAGLARPTDPQLLLDLAADVRDGGMCGLERLAPNSFLSGMTYFGQEFEDHFVRRRCPAGVCTQLGQSALSVQTA
ncbi:MAG TPA: NADH-ubiquinone oxidoreductase-F iron-sulfur binding region domain-containing protein [Candidatus Limnocylindrales bacterium]|nr:NADH-ubiquinone oxidoreductase-F iron-sulfur binding region domain-containing protein [Candidatus Limnocylindrales bacterium]